MLYKSNPWTIIDNGGSEKIKMSHSYIFRAKLSKRNKILYSAIKIFNDHNLGGMKFKDFENIRKKIAIIMMIYTNDE